MFYMKINIFLFQRDLRLSDNHGLFKALQSSVPVMPIFCYPEDDLSSSHAGAKRRIEFIHYHINVLNSKLIDFDSRIYTFTESFTEILPKLAAIFHIETVYTNNTYEPHEQKQFQQLQDIATQHQIKVLSYKDDVIFEKSEILKPDQKPYTIFTPYSKKWLAAFSSENQIFFPSEKYLNNFYKNSPLFEHENISPKISINMVLPEFLIPELDLAKIAIYHETRNLPEMNGTSLLSVHFRYGTISIRQAVRFALAHNSTWLNELIWREFFKMILWHYPNVVNNKNLLPVY